MVDRSPQQLKLVIIIDKGIVWLANHWLALTNAFFCLMVLMALAAPLLLAQGYHGAASFLYRSYGYICHQQAGSSYFMAGEQLAFCQRDLAIYSALLIGGLLYALSRQKLPQLPLRWYLFFIIPMAVDGGMQLASEWLQFLPPSMLWGMGLIAIGLISSFLRSQNLLTWQLYLFFACGPLALLYVQFYGPYESNWFRRTLTGAIFATGTVWYLYPLLEDGFRTLRRQAQHQMSQAQAKLSSG